ncbi:MAG TPA: Ig-like domain-containing protein, partial [Promineifilum sp.]|nr:Ig-like domain-containing protein [Promineifilum sp.]
MSASAISDADADDPPDHPAADLAWSFTTAAAPPADFVLINEIDADTPGVDAAEFIELFDGGVGYTDLSGLALVLWNGQGDIVYRAIDLDGYQTDAAGYFVLGNEGVPGSDLVVVAGALQNGPDAVALIAGDASAFPSGTALTTTNLIDAVVYGPTDLPDEGLLILLEAGQPQADEDARGEKDIHSLQRCPNGEGGQRRTDAIRANIPTSGCATDDAPVEVAVSPADGATGVSVGAVMMVRFSEDVAVEAGWYAIVCGQSGSHSAAISGGPREFTLRPDVPFIAGETCAVTVSAGSIRDADIDDPPDHPAADTIWQFHVAQTSVGLLINEIDADTPGADTAEFIELFDGGTGGTSLEGLVVVLWNGKNDRVYRAIDLSGHTTGPGGYFVLGSRAAGANLELSAGALQNGPDAVGLYTGRVADFPAGTLLTTAGLVDAVAYGPAASPDPGLLTLLEEGEPQVDEGSRGMRDTDSLQRCPDGAGGARRTGQVRPGEPTPGGANVCAATDVPPVAAMVSPADGTTDVAVDVVVQVTFSEDVTVDGGWYDIACEASGTHTAIVQGGPRDYTLIPMAPFAPDEMCEVRLFAAAISDTDADDPPDHPAADVVWRFHTAPPL